MKEKNIRNKMKEIDELDKYVREKKIRLKQQIYKIKTLWKFTEKRIVNFEEPILMFITNTGNVEIYEGAKGDFFTVKGSNEEELVIPLNPNKLLTFNLDNKIIKGYIVYEGELIPYPVEPIGDIAQLLSIVRKTLQTLEDWKAKKINAMSSTIMTLFKGAALLGLVYIVYRLMLS